jgi:hypothetical protein
MPKGVYERTPEMKTGKYKRTPEMNAAMSRSTKGILRSPECRAAMSSARLGVPISPHTPEHRAALSAAGKGVPLSPEHCAAISKGLKDSDAAKARNDTMRGGDDIVKHHYIYDHADLSLNTVQMTRSDHMSLHRLLQKLGYIILHVNVSDDQNKED